MRVFVIGATGYLGLAASRSLLAGGHAVAGLARSEHAQVQLRDAGVAVWRGDIAKIEAETLSEHDVVVFCPQLLVNEEAKAVAHLLAVLRGSGKTFVFVSGTGVLAQRTNGYWSEETFAEDDPFEPLKWIAERAETEALVRQAAFEGMRAMVVRPPEVWGNGGGRRANYIFEAALRLGAVPYIGPGLNLYSNVHVDDLADLVVRVIERGTSGALYHAVAGELNQRSVSLAVAHVMGMPTRSVTMDEAVDIWGKYVTLISLSVCSRTRSPRSMQELGWLPRHVDLFADLSGGSYLTRWQERAARECRSAVGAGQ